jgi:hypothetical protein
VKRKGAEGLASDLASLTSLDSDALKARWRQLYDRDPPSHVSRSLLLRALAYRLQETALGGLKPQTRRILAGVGAHAAGSGKPTFLPGPKLTPGTRLVREWQGTTHQVIVLDDGVIFRGQRHRSLSEPISPRDSSIPSSSTRSTG